MNKMYEFTDIDITDCKRTIGYVHYLIALQNLDPICLEKSISKEHQPLIDEMKRVCNLIEAYLPKCEPHNLRAYASSYAVIYTFGKLKQLDPKLLDDLDFRILDAWMDGDKRIPEIEAYSIIGRHRKELPGDLRSWYQRKQAEYFLVIDEDGKFANLGPAENYRILNALRHDSIWEQFPDCHYGWGDVAIINYTDDFEKFDTEALREYYRFQDSYELKDTLLRVKLQHESAILKELSRRPELDEYDRKGYALDKQCIDAYLAEEFEREIAELAEMIPAAKRSKDTVASLCYKFENLISCMFYGEPQPILDDDVDEDLEIADILAPVSNSALDSTVDIHFLLLRTPGNYNPALYRNVINELEKRTNNGDAMAHEVLEHYDELYHKYSNEGWRI
jgi:hypothetical protein